jgi:hypothetical protein
MEPKRSAGHGGAIFLEIPFVSRYEPMAMEASVRSGRQWVSNLMLKLILAATFAWLACLAAPSVVLANHRHIDHSPRHHHPHSRPHHREWRRH